MFNRGEGVDCEMYMRELPTKKPAAATSLAPSAEDATLVQTLLGTLFDIHVAPEFVEV